MKAMIQVATREVMERKLIFAACLMLGILSLASPLLPQTQFGGGDAKATISFFAFAFTFMFGLSLSFMTGATIISRDLAERRMSFYFSKPISHWSIWGGKMLGAFLITVIGSLLAVLPATLIGGGLFMLTNPNADPMEKEAGWVVDLIVWTIILFFIGFGHFVSTALRARSKWVALDIFGALVVGVIVYWAVRPLVTGGALEIVKSVLLAFIISLLVTIFIAGAVGLARGRTDIRIVHGTTSIVFVSLMGVVALTILLYSAWVRSADIDDLREVWVGDYSTSGDWIYVEGPAKGRADYRTGVLVNPRSGKTMRIPQQEGPSIDFSENGKKVVWGELVSFSPIQIELFVADLDGDEPKVKPLMISMKPPTGFGPVMSADGSRIALIDNETLSVYDTASGKSVASVAMKRKGQAWGYSWMSFFGNDVVRIHLMLPDVQDRTRRVTVVSEYDIPSKQMTEVARFTGYRGVPNSTRDRMLANIPTTASKVGSPLEAEQRGHVLMDRNGGVLRALTFPPEETFAAHWLLGDRIAVVTSTAALTLNNLSKQKPWRLHLLDADGNEISAFDLGEAKAIDLGMEHDQRKLVYALRNSRKDSTLKELDLSNGTIAEIARGLRPSVPRWNRKASTGVVANLYHNQHTGLVYLDPSTREQKLIAGKAEEQL